MYELYPYFTNDGSVGLFSPEADDIYHSTYGALTEAYEKFIIPAEFEKFFQKNNKIKILDICFGIGYNTKSFINNFLEFIYNGTIDTYNIKCNSEIDTDNKKYSIYIHAIDTDKILSGLSPFFATNKNNLKNDKIIFSQGKIKKMLSGKTKVFYKLKKETNIILLNLLKNSINTETEKILFSKKYSQFFDRSIIDLYTFYKSYDNNYTLVKRLSTFLHNIYYKYISSSYKNALKAFKMADFNFDLEINDARLAIINDEKKYNYIFLDAFTPSKCPCLWTIDFFKQLYHHLDDNGMILTYSNSAVVRNAFLNSGFHVGKIFSESLNKFTGTVAVKNKSLIKNELSEYDLGLMKTKAGIFYRDENLNDLNEAIIERHQKEVENSNLISSSKFIKEYKLSTK